MSELRIRTEAPAPSNFVDDWRPRAAEAPPDDGDDTPFMPLMLALEAELAALFGVGVSVHPGRALPPGAPDVAPELAALLATIRLGGDVARPSSVFSGVTTARHGRLLAEHLAPVALRLWPAGRRRPALVIDVLATIAPDGNNAGGSVVGSIRLAAPPEPVPLIPPQPLGAAALDLPLRLPVRLAAEDVPLARLLPLRPGQFIAFATVPEMPVQLGDHQVALANLLPLPDGRQQATIIAIALKPTGERA